MELLQTLVGEYDLSGLEVYEALGGNRNNAGLAQYRTPLENLARHEDLALAAHAPVSLGENRRMSPLKPRKNVLGGPLASCSENPLTGFFRTGCCDTSDDDGGSHTVCTLVTQEFLEYLQEQGNDLITPMPQHNFPGLQAGDRWCVCAPSWKQAYDAGKAAPVVLSATHEECLEHVPFEALVEWAVDKQ